MQEGFELFEAEGGSGAAGRFYKGDAFAGVQPKDMLCLLLCLCVGKITDGDGEPFPMRPIANALVTAVEAKMGQSSGNLCSLG